MWETKLAQIRPASEISMQLLQKVKNHFLFKAFVFFIIAGSAFRLTFFRVNLRNLIKILQWAYHFLCLHFSLFLLSSSFLYYTMAYLFFISLIHSVYLCRKDFSSETLYSNIWSLSFGYDDRYSISVM